jgi:hypothetical protein
MSLAYYTQYPDQVEEFDAFSLGVRHYQNSVLKNQAMRELLPSAALALQARLEIEERWMHDVMRVLHSLDGGDQRKRRECLDRLIRTGGMSDQVLGSVLHAFGDAFAHVRVRSDGVEVAYEPPLGHAIDSRSGTCPDNACLHPDRVAGYIEATCQALGGTHFQCMQCVGRLNLARIQSDDPKVYTAIYRNKAIDHGYPHGGWRPGAYNTDPDRPPISQAEMTAIIKKIQCACPRVSPPPERPTRSGGSTLGGSTHRFYY